MGVASPTSSLQILGTNGNVAAAIQNAGSASTANLTEWRNPAGTALTVVSSTGMLVLPANPVSNLDAATKQYVDQNGPWAVSGTAVYRAIGNVGIGVS